MGKTHAVSQSIMLEPEVCATVFGFWKTKFKRIIKSLSFYLHCYSLSQTDHSKPPSVVSRYRNTSLPRQLDGTAPLILRPSLPADSCNERRIWVHEISFFASRVGDVAYLAQAWLSPCLGFPQAGSPLLTITTIFNRLRRSIAELLQL